MTRLCTWRRSGSSARSTATCTGRGDHRLEERVTRLEQLIRANFWFRADDDVPAPRLPRGPLREGPQGRAPPGRALLDALLHALRLRLPLRRPGQHPGLPAGRRPTRSTTPPWTTSSTSELHDEDCPLLPAFWPVITPKDEKWDELQTIFNYEFKNKPYEYHNGGRWPMVTGFYVASLARRGRDDRARRYLDGAAPGQPPGHGRTRPGASPSTCTASPTPPRARTPWVGARRRRSSATATWRASVCSAPAKTVPDELLSGRRSSRGWRGWPSRRA